MTDWADMLAEVKASAAPAEFQKGRLVADWVVPPFTVLNTLSGDWRERKRTWLSLGIESEIGRAEDALIAEGSQSRLNHLLGGRHGASGDISGAEYAEQQYGGFKGISIFDPVLCEVAYRWWCPEGGTILDPFAGGSVRGIVAAMLGHSYTGIDLSAAQVAANREQAKRIVPGDKPMPRWYVGDSLEVLPDLPAGEQYDMVFTCPPYYDLERYSDDPQDLSAMPSYGAFLDVYQEIIAAAVRRLRRGRFAVVVVSNVRDGKTGFYNALERDTELAFERAGAGLYNEAILVNSVGTLALRANNQMAASRKLGRMHQAVLCFANGAPDARGWSYAREAPPPPQQSLGWEMPDDRPVQVDLDLTDVAAVVSADLHVGGDVYDVTAQVDAALAAGQDKVVVRLDEPADDPQPVAAQGGPSADVAADDVPAAPTPPDVPVAAPDSQPPPWAKWLPPDDTPAQPIGPLGPTSKPPARNSEPPEVREPADLSGKKKAERADACQQCGQPRTPGHEHPVWVTPETAQSLVDTGLWDGFDVVKP